MPFYSPSGDVLSTQEGNVDLSSYFGSNDVACLLKVTRTSEVGTYSAIVWDKNTTHTGGLNSVNVDLDEDRSIYCFTTAGYYSDLNITGDHVIYISNPLTGTSAYSLEWRIIATFSSDEFILPDASGVVNSSLVGSCEVLDHSSMIPAGKTICGIQFGYFKNFYYHFMKGEDNINSNCYDEEMLCSHDSDSTERSSSHMTQSSTGSYSLYSSTTSGYSYPVLGFWDDGTNYFHNDIKYVGTALANSGWTILAAPDPLAANYRIAVYYIHYGSAEGVRNYNSSESTDINPPNGSIYISPDYSYIGHLNFAPIGDNGVMKVYNNSTQDKEVYLVAYLGSNYKKGASSINGVATLAEIRAKCSVNARANAFDDVVDLRTFDSFLEDKAPDDILLTHISERGGPWSIESNGDGISFDMNIHELIING